MSTMRIEARETIAQLLCRTSISEACVVHWTTPESYSLVPVERGQGPCRQVPSRGSEPVSVEAHLSILCCLKKSEAKPAAGVFLEILCTSSYETPLRESSYKEIQNR